MRLKKKNNYFLHPFEIAISGSCEEKVSHLTKNLKAQLSGEFDIGALKLKPHDKITQGDAISSMTDKDLLFVEDTLNSELPKVLVLNDEQTKLSEEDMKSVVAVVSHQKDMFEGKYPFFTYDDPARLSAFIKDYFHFRVPKKLKGLVLTGGKSKRMEQDKGALIYHQGLPQTEYVKNLLADFCEEVYISCRADQQNLNFLEKEELLVDSFPSVGPTTGILSAQFAYPNTAWIVLACDLPYLKRETIQHLLNGRNPFKNATCYLNSEQQWPEPLCTIYEPKSHIKLMQYFSIKCPCPRKVLINSNVELLRPLDPKALANINTPLEREAAFRDISSLGGSYAG